MKLFSLLSLSLGIAAGGCLAQEPPPAAPAKTVLEPAAGGAVAVSAMEVWKSIRERQPAGLSVTLTLPKTRFYRGELIPAKLVHRNSSADPYYLWIGTYDRSGRIQDMSFAAYDEAGKPVGDPLEYYFTHYGHVGGGLGNYQDLGTWEITLPANPWLRFDKPGKYQLYAQSIRVRPGQKDALRERAPDAIPLVSDPVEIIVDPLPPQAEAALIDQARAVKIDDPSLSQNPVDVETVQRLRFLDTPSSREAIARFLDSPYGFEAMLTFYASPDYQVAAAWLLAATQEGRLGLSPALESLYTGLKTGGWLPFSRESSEPAQPVAPSPREVLQAEVKRGLRADGTGEIFFGSLLTLFRANPQDPQIRPIMLRRQLDLPDKQIREALQQKGLLADKDFLPLLRSLVTPERHNASALAALAAVAPDEARPIILEDIRRPRPIYLSVENYASARPRLFAHLALPDQELPELDALLRERLPRSRNDLFDLETVITFIERYASKALLPDVKAVYLPSEGYWACAFQTNVLRYWIRCDPVEGVAALRRALGNDGEKQTGCYQTVLDDVLRTRWVPEALPLVLEATQHKHAEVVRSAATVLKAHVGQEAVEPLVAAVEALAARPLPSGVSERNMQTYVPREMTRMLLENERWELGREQCTRLLKAVTDPGLQAQLQRRLEAAR